VQFRRSTWVSSEAGRAAAEKEDAVPIELPAVRILIVDDDKQICDYMQTLLENDGFHVKTTSDPTLVEDDVRTGEFHVIILDLMMPKRDGLSALPALRRRCPRAAVVVVTAHAAIEAFEVSRARGAAACFDKLGFLPRVPWVVSKFTLPDAAPA
jgi:CheY-like chemotaxis protein